ncbi:MAG: hypothetical protein U1B77_04285, partial [Dehalococcoidales bacterium]|nr:hypothetical protein [Dehalococcoidales bacterium]
MWQFAQFSAVTVGSAAGPPVQPEIIKASITPSPMIPPPHRIFLRIFYLLIYTYETAHYIALVFSEVIPIFFENYILNF